MKCMISIVDLKTGVVSIRPNDTSNAHEDTGLFC